MNELIWFTLTIQLNKLERNPFCLCSSHARLRYNEVEFLLVTSDKLCVISLQFNLCLTVCYTVLLNALTERKCSTLTLFFLSSKKILTLTYYIILRES